MKKKIFLLVLVLSVFFITGCSFAITPIQIITPTQVVTPTSIPIPTLTLAPTPTPIPTVAPTLIPTPTSIPTIIPTPTLAAVKSDYLITVNTTTNKLTLYKNENKVTSYMVATGKIVEGKCLSPNGKFVILNKVKEPAWGGGSFAEPIASGDPNNPLGHYWMGISAGSKPGNTWGIHGTIDETSIGKNISHGCIRMYNKEIPILFNKVPIGTNVWIGTSEDLTSWGSTNFD